MNTRDQSGYSILTALLAIALAGIVVGSIITNSIGQSKANLTNTKRTEYYYDAEDSMGRTISWIRSHSTDTLALFDPANFDTYFERSEPSLGANDTDTELGVPTKVKLLGTNNSAILSKGSNLPQATLPDSPISGGTDTFHASSNFSDSNIGSSAVKVTLVDLVESNSEEDSGSSGSSGDSSDSVSEDSDDESGDSDSDHGSEHSEGDDDSDHSESDHGESEHG